MLIRDMGEFGLIKRFKSLIKTDTSVIKGIGDDCAVINLDKDRYLLFTCDMIVEGIDFTAKVNPYLVGRKALAVAISDIAACAGIPRYGLVSLGIPRHTTVERIERIFRGMLALAKIYRINIVGGDISRMSYLAINVSLLGTVKKKNLVLRNGAKKGDIIFVSGKLGGSISGRHLKFTPRLKEAHFLVKNFKVNSMIDISDGLTQDLGHILEESKAGATIYEDLIPISKQAKGLKDALFMGEDFELLFTLSRKEAKRLLVTAPDTFKPIGEITSPKYKLRWVDKIGKIKTIEAKGFRHF